MHGIAVGTTDLAQMRAKERAQHRAAAAVASSPSATELMDLQPLSQPVLVSAAAPRYICRIVIASLLCAATIAMNVYLLLVMDKCQTSSVDQVINGYHCVSYTGYLWLKSWLSLDGSTVHITVVRTMVINTATSQLS